MSSSKFPNELRILYNTGATIRGGALRYLIQIKIGLNRKFWLSRAVSFVNVSALRCQVAFVSWGIYRSTARKGNSYGWGSAYLIYTLTEPCKRYCILVSRLDILIQPTLRLQNGTLSFDVVIPLFIIKFRRKINVLVILQIQQHTSDLNHNVRLSVSPHKTCRGLSTH